MERVNILDPTTGKVAGWFDLDAAERWSDEDPFAPNSPHRGEAIIRTARGRWVLERWTHHVGEAPSYRYISADDAREWLARNHWDGAVERHFGVPEMDAGGAPVTVGGSRRLIQAPDELWEAVDARAAELGISGSEVVRRALREFLRTGG